MTYYDTIASGYDTLYKEEQLAKLKLTLKYLHIRNIDLVLDVGCGTAFAAKEIPAKYIGIDPSFGMLEQNNGKDILVQGQAENMPFKTRQFNVVIALTSVHNFADIEKGINEMLRVGKGRFAISVLKKSAHLEKIESILHRNFRMVRMIEEDKDFVFICSTYNLL
ncbi:methyltransferase domain-containing protein [Candidatus Woesearchaeota archaeon]|nr:methyltransferase domain-containing protein [Candidatus Woesearchaeota archaeon]